MCYSSNNKLIYILLLGIWYKAPKIERWACNWAIGGAGSRPDDRKNKLTSQTIGRNTSITYSVSEDSERSKNILEKYRQP